MSLSRQVEPTFVSTYDIQSHFFAVKEFNLKRPLVLQFSFFVNVNMDKLVAITLDIGLI